VGLCLLLAAAAAHTQPADPRPEFESESIKPNNSGGTVRAEQFDGRQFIMNNSTISELLPFAFLRGEDAIVGIPAWFRTERYDIVARASSDTTEATLALMLQSMLARELKLTFHEEQRPMNAFALVVSEGGATLQRAPGPGYPACERGDSDDQPDVDCTSITMANLVKYLSFVAQDYIDSPVVNETGMKGTYALKLAWTPRRLIETSGARGVTIFDALTKQTGLKLEPRKLPAPVIVIDHAERPADN
jgi:uncharacterized protein (TIGR03435 family)